MDTYEVVLETAPVPKSAPSGDGVFEGHWPEQPQARAKINHVRRPLWIIRVFAKRYLMEVLHGAIKSHVGQCRSEFIMLVSAQSEFIVLVSIRSEFIMLVSARSEFIMLVSAS